MAEVRGLSRVSRNLGAAADVAPKVGAVVGERAMELARREIAAGPWPYRDRTGYTRSQVFVRTVAGRVFTRTPRRIAGRRRWVSTYHDSSSDLRTEVYTDLVYAPILEYRRRSAGWWWGPAWDRVRGRVASAYLRDFGPEFHRGVQGALS